MAEEIEAGCARPTGGRVGEKVEVEITREIPVMTKVGQKAPDFTAPVYHKGKFIEVKLFDYLGK